VWSFGSVRADRRIGTSAEISGFFMTLPTWQKKTKQSPLKIKHNNIQSW